LGNDRRERGFPGADRRIKRLRHMARQKGFEIIQAPEDKRESRGWRLLKARGRSRGLEIVVGSPTDGPGATLDEVEAYLDKL
jgi:hypothetical protein